MTVLAFMTVLAPKTNKSEILVPFHSISSKMGDALFDLEQVLRSSQNKMNRQEEVILNSCKAKAVRDFTVTGILASTAVWTALWKFGSGYKMGLSTGAGIFAAMWRANRSLDLCVDRILEFEGSRMQRELANIILLKHRNDPRRMQVINKHFYMEKVFDDSGEDVPKARWRYRNYFADTESMTSNHSDSNNDRTDSEPPRQVTESKQVNTQQMSRQTLSQTQQMSPQTSPAVEVTADPLDCVFGHSRTHEEIHHPDNTAEASPKRHTRNGKRARRRRRACQTEVLSE